MRASAWGGALDFPGARTRLRMDGSEVTYGVPFWGVTFKDPFLFWGCLVGSLIQKMVKPKIGTTMETIGTNGLSLVVCRHRLKNSSQGCAWLTV